MLHIIFNQYSDQQSDFTTKSLEISTRLVYVSVIGKYKQKKSLFINIPFY